MGQTKVGGPSGKGGAPNKRFCSIKQTAQPRHAPALVRA